MTVNENAVDIESEDVQSTVTKALNRAEDNVESVKASLDAFKLTDRGDGYLLVSHSDLHDADLGIVGKNEYNESKNKAELLKTIVSDSLSRTASESGKLEFTGEFKEPIIEKQTTESIVKETMKTTPGLKCKKCDKPTSNENFVCDDCKNKKASWLTADLEVPAVDEEGNVVLAANDETSKVAIKEDLPLSRSTDHLAQSIQLEEQLVSSSQEKVKAEAVNSLISMLQSMGYGTAHVAEVTASKEGFDVMVTVDADGTTKAVNIPVKADTFKVVLPKKSLVSTLVNKGLDIRARLTEDFGREILERIAAIEEKVAYEQAEVESIINERPAAMTKEAMDSKNTQFLGDTDVLTIQKHLLPGWENLKKGDKISDGSDQWEIFDMEAQQNDKNEGSSSLWKLRKCAPPKSDEKEPEVKIPS